MDQTRQLKDEEWHLVRSRKSKRHPQVPISSGARASPATKYWDGFSPNGERKWVIELTDGRLVSAFDPDFLMWNRRLNPSED